jgi:uncharacterized protein (TIGR02687 family)
MNVIDVLKNKYSNLKERKIIFWIDEHQEFESQFNEIDFENLKKHQITAHNNLYTKYLLEKEDVESHYLIYYPFALEFNTSNWLSDIMLYSEVFQSDYASLLMEDFSIVPSSNFRKLIKQYKSFFNSKQRVNQVKKLRSSFDQPIELEMSILAVLSESKTTQFVDILAQLLSGGLDKESNSIFQNIMKFCTTESFNSIIDTRLGFQNITEKSLLHFWSYISCNAMAYKVKGLKDLSDVNQFINPTYSHICYDVMSELSTNDKLTDSLIEMLFSVEEFLKLEKKFQSMEETTLIQSDAFPIIHSVLFSKLSKKLIAKNSASKDVFDGIAVRKELKGYSLVESFFEALFYAAKMIKFKVDHDHVIPFAELPQLWEQYHHDYYLMDQYYRHFVYWANQAISLANEHFDDQIKDLADHIENLYKNWFLDKIGERWSIAIENKDLDQPLSNILSQKNFYNQFISSWVNQNVRTFVIISDAMRYEVGRELNEQINTTTALTSTISSLMSVTPSITKFGMAALLPHQELTLSNDLVLVDGLRSDGIENRIKILKKVVSDSDAIQAKKFKEMRRIEREEFVRGKKLIYIYHNLIDSIGDTLSTESEVFDACKDTIQELNQLTQLIFKEFNAKSVYITADHGFVYTKKSLKEDEQISLNLEVNEDTILNRRFVITENTSASQGYLRYKLTSIGSDKQLLAPKHYLRFRMAGGGTNYIHGGLSLQELMIPVLSIKPSSGISQDDSSLVQLSLITESRKITNLSFMLEFFQNEPIRDKIMPCNFYIQFIDINDRVISDKQLIIGDKTSPHSNDRLTRKQFTLKQQKYDANATYTLIIGNQDQPSEIFSKTEFKISVIFSDDFDL